MPRSVWLGLYYIPDLPVLTPVTPDVVLVRLAYAAPQELYPCFKIHFPHFLSPFIMFLFPLFVLFGGIFAAVFFLRPLPDTIRLIRRKAPPN